MAEQAFDITSLVESVQTQFNGLTGSFVEKLAGQADAVINKVAPLVLPQFPGLNIDTLKQAAEKLVPKEGVTFDQLLDIIEVASNPDTVSSLLSSPKQVLTSVVNTGLGALQKEIINE